MTRLFWAALGTAAALAAGGLIETAHRRKIARDPERELLNSPPEGRAQTARSADGTALHVEVFGPDDGPTVVLVHGWTEAHPVLDVRDPRAVQAWIPGRRLRPARTRP